jgi:hypothetical protein
MTDAWDNEDDIPILSNDPVDKNIINKPKPNQSNGNLITSPEPPANDNCSDILSDATGKELRELSDHMNKVLTMKLNAAEEEENISQPKLKILRRNLAVDNNSIHRNNGEDNKSNDMNKTAEDREREYEELRNKIMSGEYDAAELRNSKPSSSNAINKAKLSNPNNQAKDDENSPQTSYANIKRSASQHKIIEDLLSNKSGRKQQQSSNTANNNNSNQIPHKNEYSRNQYVNSNNYSNPPVSLNYSTQSLSYNPYPAQYSQSNLAPYPINVIPPGGLTVQPGGVIVPTAFVQQANQSPYNTNINPNPNYPVYDNEYPSLHHHNKQQQQRYAPNPNNPANYRKR